MNRHYMTSKDIFLQHVLESTRTIFHSKHREEAQVEREYQLLYNYDELANLTCSTPFAMSIYTIYPREHLEHVSYECKISSYQSCA